MFILNAHNIKVTVCIM